MSKGTIHPLGCRITVQPLEEASGIEVIRYDESYSRGIILEVGTGGQCDDLLNQLEPGMVVHFTQGCKINTTVVVDVRHVLGWEGD